MTDTDPTEQLVKQIKLLLESVWDRQADLRSVEQWLSQFKDDADLGKSERFQMLFLLSQFMYFGMFEIRSLLRSLYRDNFQYSLIENIRISNKNTKNRTFISAALNDDLKHTRFIGFGNPSESSYHILYYFRQENGLPKDLFITPDQIFQATPDQPGASFRVRAPTIRNYVFIDDLCGSGQQAEEYANNAVVPLKALAPNPLPRIWYLTLFATSEGLKRVRSLGHFDEVGCVVELDDSFKCFAKNSRYYANERGPINRVLAEQVCRTYGRQLFPSDPLGYRDGQLLLGFSHNTPDNTLPIFHYNYPDAVPWTPLFKRYPKF